MGGLPRLADLNSFRSDADMRCKQARQLFDAYLDGGLSSALEAELGAHRVQCAECRRALALLEVSGQILESDRDPVELRHDFADRLLACMDEPKSRSWDRAKLAFVYAGPIAAAALIALAFLGAFDRGNGPNGGGVQVAGEQVYNPNVVDSPSESVEGADSNDAELRLKRFIEQTQKSSEEKRESVQSLQKALNYTVDQWLEILDQAKDDPAVQSDIMSDDDSGDAGTDEEPLAAESDDTTE